MKDKELQQGSTRAGKSWAMEIFGIADRVLLSSTVFKGLEASYCVSLLIRENLTLLNS